MTVPHEEAYRESRVYSATPAELIHILYEAALEAVREAARANAAGQIAERARGIGKATSCVMELAGSLNVAVGGELGVRLAVLYEYLLHRLLEASTTNSAQALESCEQVLSALWDGWGQAMPQMPVTPPDGLVPTDRAGYAATGAEFQTQSATRVNPALPAELQDDPLIEDRISFCA